MAVVRVMLVDDHAEFRQNLGRFLNLISEIKVVGMVSSGDEALQLAQKIPIDVIVLDIDMPGKNGIEVTQQIQQRGDSVRVLMFSAYDSHQFIEESRAKGAAGYLVKGEVLPDEIVEAIITVASGQEYWPGESLSQTSAVTGVLLSNLEKDVLRAIVAGKTNREISQLLGVSQETVEDKLVDIFAKLKVVSRVKAAVRAVQEQLV
jgi:DNA-binding NarL/FixJ family response regulator